MSVYMSGSLVQATATFYNSSGTPTDPSTITLNYKAGSGDVTSLTYANEDLTRVSAGVYSYDFDTTGWTGPRNQTYTLEWVGTGTCQAITGDSFEVSPSVF